MYLMVISSIQLLPCWKNLTLISACEAQVLQILSWWIILTQILACKALIFVKWSLCLLLKILFFYLGSHYSGQRGILDLIPFTKNQIKPSKIKFLASMTSGHSVCDENSCHLDLNLNSMFQKSNTPIPVT